MARGQLAVARHCGRRALESQFYLSRQDHIFSAAVDAVLALGDEIYREFPSLMAFETKATVTTDGSVGLAGVVPGERTEFFVVVQAEPKTRWLFRKRFVVTVHWGIPDESIKPLLSLFDPAVPVSTRNQVRSEPLAPWLSKVTQNEVVGLTRPDRVVRIDFSGKS